MSSGIGLVFSCQSLREHFHISSFITRAKAANRDLSSICWAIGSYWEIAKKRAEYWQKCETAFSHLIPGRTHEDTENIGQVMSKSANLSRKALIVYSGMHTQ